MRRTMAAGALALVTALATLPGGTATAKDGGTPDLFDRDRDRPRPELTLPEQASPRAVLATAKDVLTGTPEQGGPSATIALRNLRAAAPSLRGEEREQAEEILARPTSGGQDPFGGDYTVRSRKTCGKFVCVHWVRRTEDAPPNQRWVRRNKRLANSVYRAQTRKLGYRRPLSDGGRGGNNKLDVYLKNVGEQGIYGYCAAERLHRKYRRAASGYCILDNDFSRREFGAPPGDSLKVTAVHELFHAVQFAYDYLEDGWMMESTATWMEERLADGVNDNRQYLGCGQLSRPDVPLDYTGSLDCNRDGVTDGPTTYGNWIFWEYLGQRYGKGIVKKAWAKAGSRATRRSARQQYSIKVLKSLLRKKGGFTKVYTRFHADNLMPRRTYPEGGASEYRGATTSGYRLTQADPSGAAEGDFPHLVGVSPFFEPDPAMDNRRWRLKLRLDGPPRKTGPGGYVVVNRTNGSIDRFPVRLNKRGNGHVTVPFNHNTVRDVAFTVVNASTRYRCHRGWPFACNGKPRDEGRTYQIGWRAFQQN